MSYLPPYIINSQLYFGLFPKEWAVSHNEGTGPTQCINCYHYGMISECFAFYCNKCASTYEDYHRGYGVIANFVEVVNIPNYDLEKSAYNTYLRYINFNNLITIKEIIKYRSFIKYFNYDKNPNIQFYYNILDMMVEHNSLSFAMLDSYEINMIAQTPSDADADADDEDDDAYLDENISRQIIKLNF